MEKKCIICNKEFFVKPSHYDNRKTCSKTCMSEFYKTSLSGDKNPHWKGGITKLERACIYCGSQFKTRVYDTGKYCSRLCQNRKQANDKKLQAEERRKNKPPKVKNERTKKKWICQHCGMIEVKRRIHKCRRCIEVIKTTSLISFKCKTCNEWAIRKKGYPKMYCSLQCSNKDNVGAGNPNWKGGITPENQKIRASPEYKQWRIAVFERDKYTCVFCGQVGWTLHADHIKPFALYPELRLDLNNGRTLCKSCHEKTPTYLKGTSIHKNKTA